MLKNCKQCSGDFEVTEDDLAFLEQIAPVYAGKKYAIPAPDYCPLCRLQRRMCFRNERSLYRRKCDATGKDIISCYAPGTDFIVYEHDYWWSDKWDALSFGRNFDFTRTLTEQLKELSLAVPHSSLVNVNCLNCDYTNFFIGSKNSYLVFGGSHNENIMYGKFIINCKNDMDGLSLVGCELCYQGNSSQDCYDCRYFLYSRNCSNCLMVEECSGCRNCIACFGLRNKEYYFLNKYVGKEKFEELATQYKDLSHGQIQNLSLQLAELSKDLPRMNLHMYASEDCTGDVVLNSKNCENCFSVRSAENCKYVCFSPFANNSRDGIFSAPGPTEFCYQTCSIVGQNNSMALFLVWSGGSNLYYSIECHSCSDCFGCVGLKNKRYCVFNKQYSKEEYETLVGKIIEHMAQVGEWGQFLDPKLSFFGHNETVAQEYFQITKEQALSGGFKWRDEGSKQFKASSYKIPETILEVGDEVVKEILLCEICNKNYRIIPEELRFYRLVGVPLPKKCFDCRHMERISKTNGLRLYEKMCAKCNKKIKTIYNSERPEKIYCEECYLEEIY